GGELKSRRCDQIRGERSGVMQPRPPLAPWAAISPSRGLSRHDIELWTLSEHRTDNRHLFGIPLETPLLRRAEQRLPVTHREFGKQTAPLFAPGLGRAV